MAHPRRDCASPIWFIFYLHKCLEEAKKNFCSYRDKIVDLNHDHNYSKSSKKVTVPKGQRGFSIDQQYADDISWATTNKSVKDSIKKETPKVLKKKNLIANEEKTEDYEIYRNSSNEWKKCKLVGTLLGNEEDIKRRRT